MHMTPAMMIILAKEVNIPDADIDGSGDSISSTIRQTKLKTDNVLNDWI